MSHLTINKINSQLNKNQLTETNVPLYSKIYKITLDFFTWLSCYADHSIEPP